MLSSALSRLRLLGYLEGGSFLLLLGIAMPLKYMFDLPLAVRYVGMIHGLLFIAFVLAIPSALEAAGWNWKRGLLLLGSAFVPFGPFLMDKSLREAEQNPPEAETN